MKKDYSKLLTYLCIALALSIANIFIFNYFLWDNGYTLYSFKHEENSGTIRLSVKDIMTNIPIENANICIVETNKYFTTDKMGNSPYIKIPIMKNKNFDSSMEREWGDVTILVYKDGYVDYILFYCIVDKNKTRLGPTILLRPNLNDSSSDIYSIIESPKEEWIKNLVNKYKR